MADEIGITLSGDRVVGLRLERLPVLVHDKVLARIRDLTAQLLGDIRAAEPSKTGKLRRATQQSVRQTEDRITGRVGITEEFAKAAALEYGAHGTAHLRAHTARLGHVYSRLISPIEVRVGAHDRHLNIRENRFERGSLEAMRGEILAQLQEALSDAAEAG